jgi:hypothetical protein
VLRYLDAEDGEILFDAIRAAGELALEEARDPLLEKLDDTLDDQELRFAIIWSLSQIGGEAVKKKLEELAEKGADDEEAELIEKAMDNIELGGQLEGMEMLEYDADEDLEDEDIDDDDSDEDEDEFVEVDELDEDDEEN